jgi:hypothetical protein
VRSLGPVFVGMFAANVAVLAGLGMLGLGVPLLVTGVGPAWLPWAGLMLTVLGLAVRYLAARTVRPSLDQMAAESLTTIYMPLINEGVDVWRPVEAMKIGELGYMVTQNAPPEEDWAFQPGQILRCEERVTSEGSQLVAISKAT